ncbi:proteasome maturation protein [Magallana gigas]|uniref:Proteasome maturation protein n=3 Tax=Magallana gigas TaxID=29159 RepID=A0A8W8LGA5_MAGGI|nr:proteasome maturation protein [Crassostrea gigas]|eukprot:XP_019918012.1 PREDICTED: proteasome maturation protein [Crassostrea gigas]
MASTNIPYPSVRPQPDGSQEIKLPEGPYGVPDVMLNGIQSSKAKLGSVHPLEYSEKHWHENKQKMDFAMLRNTQGIHMPLRLQMEKNVAQKINRLPGMHSSNLMSDTLSGRDEMIDFEDILNNPADCEVMGDTHLLMDRRAGLL